MKIFISTDHRGYYLKGQIIEYLKKYHEVIDLGNDHYDEADDYVDFAFKTSNEVLNNPGSFGIVICGSGVGVCIAANRIKNIRCALGFDENQVKHARENDHINILALPSDFIDLEKAKTLINSFILTEKINEERFLRRINKLDS